MSSLLENTTAMSDPSTEEFVFSIPKSRMIIFSFLIALLIPSLLCSIYLFYQFIRVREIRRRDTNFIIICLVIVNFIQAILDIPLALVFLYFNRTASMTPIFCQWWSFISASLFGVSLWIMAVGSIERHFFIFHSASLKKYKVILRYIPLTCCFLFPVFFNIFLVFLFPCTNDFIYFIYWCGAPCYMKSPFWQVFSWFADLGIPMCILVIANIILTIRVLQQKHRMQQTRLWSKNARMFLQLISVACLYAICWIPFLVSGQINTYTNNQSPYAFMLFFEYFIYSPFLTTTLCPFVCLFGIWRDLAVVFHRPQISVRPIATIQTNRKTTVMNKN
ncbi:hypothetical protein I4U23_017509 [Adineta vaga]|nr:hypothetical protein I4U23_017509 [Adineta vaga]